MKQDPICNAKSAETARAAYDQFSAPLNALIADLTTQLHGLIQAKHSLERLFNGGAMEGLNTELNVVSMAMQRAASNDTIDGEVIESAKQRS